MAANLKSLIQQGKVVVARLPKKNNIEVGELDALAAYTVPLIAHDYGALTPLMWNTVYEMLGVPLRNIMVVASSESLEEVLGILKNDPKYLGGGVGVGLKEKVIPHLDAVHPEDLNAVNIIVKEGGMLIGYNTDAQGLYQSLQDALAEVRKTVKESTVVLYGAGGVAKEFARLLARNDVGTLRIVNRTVSKAVRLAHELNTEYEKDVAIGVGEDLSRGVVLNSYIPVDALVNTTDKGSDGPLEHVAMYAAADDHNESHSRALLRYLRDLRPDVVIVDIVLPKKGDSVSLRLARAEGIEHLVDGKPMVVNQAAPAYCKIQKAYPQFHGGQKSEREILGIMRGAVQRA